ncbi:MAG TPA: hypothetical protein VMQ99_12345 [Acetobacteraceae bacterium]|jgi:hypothetical protein|nr:hypothetical protein [Acetobacteraceae bacterium]
MLLNGEPLISFVLTTVQTSTCLLVGPLMVANTIDPGAMAAGLRRPVDTQ